MLETSSLAQYINMHLKHSITQYLKELYQLGEIESCTFHKAGIDQMATWICQWVKSYGWKVHTWLDQETGRSLVITLYGGNPGGLRVLLGAHLDTMPFCPDVAQRRLRRDGDHLICPGIAAKGGILSGLYVMQAIEELDLLGSFGCISLVCGSDKEDEEHGMPSSTALLHKLAPEYDIAFILEAGCENGDIIGTRRGYGKFILENQNQANPSNAVFSGEENCVMALARQVIALQELNGMRAGITVNVGVVQGEAPPICETNYARAEIAVWVDSSEEKEIVSNAIAHITSRPFAGGALTSLKSDWRFAPLEATSENKALATLAKTCAHELNFHIAISHMRGLSYANILAGLNLPVLDGFGPCGGYFNTPFEYLDVSSIMPRIALLTLLVMRNARQ